jgi:AcrR family transcriptional regulator
MEKIRRAKSSRSGRQLQARGTTTAAALLDAAMEVIAENGYVHTTTAEIAERAGVTRGALQYHFPSRNDLIVAIIDHIASQFRHRVAPAALLGPGTSVEQRVKAVINEVSQIFSDKYYKGALQVWLGVAGDRQLNRRVADQARRDREAIIQAWAEIFPELAADRRRLASVVRVIEGALRGLAVSRFVEPVLDWNADLLLLEEMLLEQIATALRRQ